MPATSPPGLTPLRSLDQVRSLFRRLIGLSTREQLALYLAFRQYLSGALHAPLRVDTEIEARANALTCLADVAAALELPQGIAPTAQQYRSIASALGLDMSVTAIANAFDTWAQARLVYSGARARETAGQRSIRRALLGTVRRSEDYIVGVRLFLATDPASVLRCDYDAFVAEWNDSLADGRLPLVISQTVLAQTSLTWEEVLAVARGEATREELLKRRVAPARRRDWGALVGLQGAAAILDRGSPHVARLAQRAEFPRPVIIRQTRGRPLRIWRRTDIEAFKAGSYRAGTPQVSEMDALFASDLAVLLGIGHNTMLAYMTHARHRVPEPAGRASGLHYWWRSDVMDWLTARANRP